MNDTEARRSKLWKKIIFNLELYVETINYVWVYKKQFIHEESQENFLPMPLSQEVTEGCVLPKQAIKLRKEDLESPQNRIQYKREAKRILCAGVPDLG